MDRPKKPVQEEVFENLYGYLVASGLIKNFIEYDKEYGTVAPVIMKDNVAYVVEFREGLNVKLFLREQLKNYPDKASQLLINTIIAQWQEAVKYILLMITVERND